MSIQQLLLCDKPKVTPGSQTYNSGTHDFTVPLFNTLTIELWGAGASPGGYNAPNDMYPGVDGGDSYIASLSLYARGGKGSSDGIAAPAGGAASGGSTNTGGQAGGVGKLATTNPYTAPNGGNSGGGAAGGTGGSINLPYILPSSYTSYGSAGGAPGAGCGGNAFWDAENSWKSYSASGGGGGYVSRTYTAAIGAAVQYGDILTAVVGTPGELPGTGFLDSFAGGAGKIKFTWS